MAIDLRVGRSGQMLDACGLPGEYQDALKMPAGLIHLFGELYTAHWGKGGKGMAVRCAGVCCGQFGWTPMPNESWS